MVRLARMRTINNRSSLYYHMSAKTYDVVLSTSNSRSIT
jgi:hypothetical protein